MATSRVTENMSSRSLSSGYVEIAIENRWMWVKMEDLGDHRCYSSLVLTIHNFGVPNFDPYPDVNRYSIDTLW